MLAQQPYRLWGAAHGHLHAVALPWTCPQVVHHLPQKLPSAGPSDSFVGLPRGSRSPRGAPPSPASASGQPDAGLGAVGRQHPRSPSTEGARAVLAMVGPGLGALWAHFGPRPSLGPAPNSGAGGGFCGE